MLTVDVVTPQRKIVEGAQIEFFSLLKTRLRQHRDDLEFSDLIGNGLSRPS